MVALPLHLPTAACSGHMGHFLLSIGEICGSESWGGVAGGADLAHHELKRGNRERRGALQPCVCSSLQHWLKAAKVLPLEHSGD